MRSQKTGQLYLDGEHVGDIAIQQWQGAWGMGAFTPRPAFGRFEPIYNEWARLMHADADSQRLSPRVAKRLRKVESAMYAIRAKLFLVEMRQWRDISILNIDGSLIEWKEAWGAASPAVTNVGS